MRVVIDASIDQRLVEAFAGHDVHTLFDLGWQHLTRNYGTRSQRSGLAKWFMFPVLPAASQACLQLWDRG